MKKKKKQKQKQKQKIYAKRPAGGGKRPSDHRAPRRGRRADRERIAPDGAFRPDGEYLFGVFHGNRRGFGFVTPDDPAAACDLGIPEGADLFVPERYTGDAMDGDRVKVRVTSVLPGERGECRVWEVTGRGREKIIGTVREENVGTVRKPRMITVVTPDDEKLPFEVVAERSGGVEARPGDKVEAAFTQFPRVGRVPRALITANFGPAGSRDANYAAILRANGISESFPDEALAEVEEQAKRTPRMTKSRRDLTGAVIFTIDGADAKDLDDAVSIEKTPSGWTLGVHIADVSYYVAPGSALDREAFARGTSVYFTDKVVPMLPPALSNGICSLNAGTRRYAQSAFISLDKNGEIVGCELAETLIKSRVRGVYGEVNDIFAKGGRSRFAKKYAEVLPALKEMKTLYRVLAAKSRRRGMLELETAEAAILLDQNGDPAEIVRRERGDAEKMIEQFMLAANEAVATLMCGRGLPCVYRVHDGPDPEKLAFFAEFAHNLGLPAAALRKDRPSPADFAATLEAASEKGIGEVVSGVALRSLAKARYSASVSRHFGLGIEKYCHFTSPIRRYPDLAVHRIVKTMLRGGDASSYRAFAVRAAEQSSENELRAVSAERAIEDMYKCVWLSRRAGEEFDGVVTAVAPYGFYVGLANTCEGLVRASSLSGYFEYDERSMSLFRGRDRFTVGTRVRVAVGRCDISSGKCDFELISKK
ncbi:MAG: ribonuclease R [Clostridia bacterium]|nr:ribonuclease R [Clostridia bacterium]